MILSEESFREVLEVVDNAAFVILPRPPGELDRKRFHDAMVAAGAEVGRLDGIKIIEPTPAGDYIALVHPATHRRLKRALIEWRFGKMLRRYMRVRGRCRVYR